jgi:hypothetical protein
MFTPPGEIPEKGMFPAEVIGVAVAGAAARASTRMRGAGLKNLVSVWSIRFLRLLRRVAQAFMATGARGGAIAVPLSLTRGGL